MDEQDDCWNQPSGLLLLGHNSNKPGIRHRQGNHRLITREHEWMLTTTNADLTIPIEIVEGADFLKVNSSIVARELLT